MSHIFISYSKQDIDFVRYFRTLLEVEGFPVWIVEVRLTPSARWWRSIEKNIETCAAFVVIMSPNAAESDWVEREILLAERLKKPIFPVLLGGEHWSRLANIQFEDMRAGLRAKASACFLKELRRAVPVKQTHKRNLLFTIEQGDIMTFSADVVAFKYAEKFSGADAAVHEALLAAGVEETDLLPPTTNVGDFRYVETQGVISAAHALFVTTPRVRQISYLEIRQFAARVLEVLKDAAPDTRHLAMTIHGANFGLDEREAFFSQFGGFRRAMLASQIPLKLERISIVEHRKDRVRRLRTTMEMNLAEASYAKPLQTGWGYVLEIQVPDTGINTPALTPQPEQAMSAAETDESKQVKRHAYVAMPIKTEMDDIFYYGILAPIHALGMLCERIDQSLFTLDLLGQARERIESAAVFIADFSGADPAVYLQLGYAWGKGRPVILLAHEGENITFNTNNPPLFFYQRIKDVEDGITQALEALKHEGMI